MRKLLLGAFLSYIPLGFIIAEWKLRQNIGIFSHELYWFVILLFIISLNILILKKDTQNNDYVFLIILLASSIVIVIFFLYAAFILFTLILNVLALIILRQPALTFVFSFLFLFLLPNSNSLGTLRWIIPVSSQVMLTLILLNIMESNISMEEFKSMWVDTYSDSKFFILLIQQYQSLENQEDFFNFLTRVIYSYRYLDTIVAFILSFLVSILSIVPNLRLRLEQLFKLEVTNLIIFFLASGGFGIGFLMRNLFGVGN